MFFEWDPAKAEKNFKKHKVSFTKAATIFDDELSITIFDPEHSAFEDRFIIIGMSELKRFLMVSHTDRKNRIRIISARELTWSERREYEEEISRRKRQRS